MGREREMEKQEYIAKYPEYPKPVGYIAHSGETLKYAKFAMRFLYEKLYTP